MNSSVVQVRIGAYRSQGWML